MEATQVKCLRKVAQATTKERSSNRACKVEGSLGEDIYKEAVDIVKEECLSKEPREVLTSHSPAKAPPTEAIKDQLQLNSPNKSRKELEVSHHRAVIGNKRCNNNNQELEASHHRVVGSNRSQEPEVSHRKMATNKLVDRQPLRMATRKDSMTMIWRKTMMQRHQVKTMAPQMMTWLNSV
jgi:hypothetical protein